MGAESRTGSSGMSGSWLKLMPSKAAGPGQAAQLLGEAGMVVWPQCGSLSSLGAGVVARPRLRLPVVLGS